MEKQALEKHEYYNGEIFAMSGASARHNIISINIIVALGIALKGKSCRPYGSDMRVHIPENFRYAEQRTLESEFTEFLNFLNRILF